MHIHDYEKLWLGAALLLIVAFIATVTYGAIGPGVAMVDDSGGTIDPGAVSGLSFNETENFREPGVYQVGENEYAAYVVARRFSFQPDPVVVPADSTVTFHVTSADVIHGMSVVGTNANTMVIPGVVSTLTVEVNDPREFGIVCHEYCGAGHHDMAGILNVTTQERFEAVRSQ